MWTLYLIVGLFCVGGVWCQMDEYFLPKNVRPIRYNLTVAPDTFNVEKGVFYGTITIDLEALENTKNITLHFKDLKINKYLIIVTDESGNRIRLRNATVDENKEFYIIHLRDELQKGRRYKLQIGKYIGSLLNEKAGFFYANYKDPEGNLKYMVVTEFEPTDARRTFPCFDEPDLKATFIVNIIREGKYISASNEELVSIRDLGHNLFLDTFKETVPMSTYLLAFTICEFKYTNRNSRTRLLVQPEALKDGRTEFMLEKSAKLLRNIEQYTGIPYVLSKLDMLAVPEQYFLDGAMENWGLVVYNQKYLLCSNNSKVMDIQKCVTYSGHEFSHQWFGNLVTAKSWHYIWLSEGFAAYFQYFVTALVEPSWRLDEQYVTEELQSCLRNDLASSSEPVNFIFTNPDEFPSSTIYYYKASALIRMTEHFMTHNLFVQSLKLYLHKHQFSSAVPEDLLEAYQYVIDKARANHLLGDMTVQQVLNPWLTNVGHPIVTVTRNYRTGHITFSQETFDVLEEIEPTIWPIPVTYYLEGFDPRSFENTTTDLWLTKKSATILVPLTHDWILVNKHVVGYYRVTYDETNWKHLINFFQTKDFTIIPPVNRAQILDDAMFLAQSSKLDFDLALNLSTYLRRETDYIPISSFLRTLAELDLVLGSKPEFPIYKNYIKWLLNPVFKIVGLKERSTDTHIDRLHRTILSEWMCRLEDSYCQEIGIEYLKLWKSTGVLEVPIDLQFPLLCGAIQVSDIFDWEFLFQQYHVTQDHNVKSQIIKALGCTTEKYKINHFMDIIFDLSINISPGDRSTAIANMMTFSDKGMNAVLDYLITSNISDKKYKNAFDADEAVVGLSQSHELKLNTLQGIINLKDFPILFYTDESLTSGELLFINEAVKWLRKNSKNFVEYNNNI